MSRDTPTTHARAFAVSCCDGEKSHVVFAHTRAKARADGPDCGMCSFIDRKVRRTPEFDGGMPTQREMVAAGWWFGCPGPDCDNRVDEDEFTVMKRAVEDKDGDVFCSEACRDEAHAYRKVAREALDKRLAEYAAKKEGGAA